MQSVDRAVLLLRAVAATGTTGAVTAELGRSCGLNRATAWRILWTLASHGLVVHDGGGRWRLGMAVLEIARSGGLDVVLHDVRDVLERLSQQTGETAALARLSSAGELAYVEEVTPAAAVAVSWVGRAISLHATSTGKVLLAWSRPDEADALLTTLDRFTATTVTDLAELREQLQLTRARGWATCEGEYDADAWGASAPVLGPDGRVSGVLSLWGPSSRVPAERLPVLGDLVAAAARRLGAG